VIEMEVVYEADPNLNLVVARLEGITEMMMIASGEGTLFSEHTSFPVLAPREALEIETNDGLVRSIRQIGEQGAFQTVFTYNDRRQITTIDVEGTRAVEYEYDANGNVVVSRWLQREFAAHILYDCKG
jgi:YD repeat-containing protein